MGCGSEDYQVFRHLVVVILVTTHENSRVHQGNAM